MLITVAICTYNRATSLRRALDSLAAMRIPERIDWEVVVVNNNCTDDTSAVIRSFADRLPIREAVEPTPGKSNACNRAIDVARGDYFVWTDDDVIVDPGWLAAYIEAFRRHPEAAIFAGPIRPRYEEPAVKWVIESEGLLRGAYAIRDFTDENEVLSPVNNRLPLGVNMAIRGAEQRPVRYDPRFGPSPTSRRNGEEMNVVHRILATGAIGYAVPGARLEHCIGHDRQTVRYLMRYFYGTGDHDAFYEHQIGQGYKGPWLLGVPRWIWPGVIESWLMYRLLRLISPAPVWVRHMRAYAHAAGALHYWLGEARHSAAPSSHA